MSEKKPDGDKTTDPNANCDGGKSYTQTGTADPLGVSVVMYAAAPIGPDPWRPAPRIIPSMPPLPSITEQGRLAHDTDSLEKAIADLGARIDRLTAAVESMVIGLKVREAAEEILRQIARGKAKEQP